MRGIIVALVGFVCLAAMGSDVRMQTFPDGARVAFFGDSITHNGGAMLRIAAHYRTAFPNRDVRFYNVGISGGGLAAAEMYFDKYLAAIKPTHVVFAFGVNDSNSPDGFRERYAALVGRIASLGASVILRTTTPYNEFGKGTAAARKGRNEAHRRIADEIRAFAEERRLPVLDDFSRMSKFLADGEEVFSGDRLHPNDYGQWRMADTLLAAQGQKIAVFQPLDEVAASSGLEAWHAQSQKLADILSCEWLLVRDETLDLDAKLAKVRTWLETTGARPDANRFMVGLAHRYSDDKPRETAIRADMDAAWDNIVARCRSRCMN